MQRYSMVARCRFGDGTMVAVIKAEKEDHSRLAFFDVCLFVTASEGEELVVDVRHDGGCDCFCGGKRVTLARREVENVPKRWMAGGKGVQIRGVEETL